MKSTPIVTRVVAYDDVASGETYLLIFHQALYIKSLGSQHLLNPNQMREAGIQVNDIPLQFIRGRPVTKDDHSIIHENLHIPLSRNGVISFFNVHKPTTEEIQNLDESWRIDMTPDNRIKNPNDSAYEADERILHDGLGVNANIASIENRRINSICHNVVADIHHTREGTVSPTEISRRWGIGLETAQRTLRYYTTRSPRLHKHFWI